MVPFTEMFKFTGISYTLCSNIVLTLSVYSLLMFLFSLIKVCLLNLFKEDSLDLLNHLNFIRFLLY